MAPGPHGERRASTGRAPCYLRPRVEPDYWRRRWREGRTGWQLAEPNPHLVRHRAVLEGARRILVPLCGKSRDLAWLRSEIGAEVVGVELVAEAARTFFEEHGLSAERIVEGSLERWRGGGIEIVCGDLFALGPAQLGRFDGAFDRAALYALPPPLRARYVPQVRALLEPGARLLLVSLVHDAGDAEPPFSVGPDEVRALYADLQVTALDRTDVTASSESLRARGAHTVLEDAWRLVV